MYYVYMLRSRKNGLIYTGSTGDLRKRLNEHNRGESFSTKPYVPWDLAFYAAFETRGLAEDFEKYLKFGSGKAFAQKRLIRRG